MINTKILEIEVYHGGMTVSNDYYIEHFNKKEKDISHFLTNIIGRKKRYMIDTEADTNLSMALKAAGGVLKKAGLTGKDIDLIAYSSVLPEYTIPPCSIHIHEAIGGKADCICYDYNVNCAGMTVGIEQICKYMHLSENVNTALIIGCDYVNHLLDSDNEYCYGHYGDAACAIILQKTDEQRGFLGAKYAVNSAEHNNILFPGCGFSNLFREPDREALRMVWLPFENVSIDTAVKNMRALLDENNLCIDDIKMFCLSQYALANVKSIRELMGIDESRSIFVGDKYGYTGTSSPYIALYEAINQGLVQRGDYIMIWTIGGGSENIAMLMQY